MTPRKTKGDFDPGDGLTGDQNLEQPSHLVMIQIHIFSAFQPLTAASCPDPYFITCIRKPETGGEPLNPEYCSRVSFKSMQIDSVISTVYGSRLRGLIQTICDEKNIDLIKSEQRRDRKRDKKKVVEAFWCGRMAEGVKLRDEVT